MSALATHAIVQPPFSNSTDESPRSFGLDLVLQRARRCLLSMQNADGHWRGELQGDTILESEFVLLMAFLGREEEPRVWKAANYILTQSRKARLNAIRAGRSI